MSLDFRYFRMSRKAFEENPATFRAVIRGGVHRAMHPDDYVDPAVLDEETAVIWNAMVDNIVGDHGLYLIEDAALLQDLISVFARLGEPAELDGYITWNDVIDYPRNLILYDDMSFNDTVVSATDVVGKVATIDQGEIVLPEQELVKRIVELRHNINLARTCVTADMAELKNLCEQLAEI